MFSPLKCLLQQPYDFVNLFTKRLRNRFKFSTLVSDGAKNGSQIFLFLELWLYVTLSLIK